MAASIADMLDIPVAPLQDGARVWVASKQTNYFLSRTSALVVDNVDVFQPIPQARAGAASAKWIAEAAASGGTSLVEGTTLAVLPTISGVDANTIIFVFDTQAEYRWSPGGALTQDGWIIVNAPGGQWILQGDRMTLTPLGGGADDWARLFGPGGAAPAAASHGKAIVMNAGTWECQTVHRMPPNFVLYGGPDVFVRSSLTNTGVGGFENTVFIATKGLQSPNNLLTSDAVLGTNTINVTSPVALGSTLVLGYNISGDYAEQATVIGVSNGGLTLLLDEDILYNYWTVANAAYVYTYDPLSVNITIYGNGMTVYGTGDRACEFAFGRNVHVDNIIVNPSLNTGPDGFQNIIFSMDVAMRDSGYSRCRADGGSDILTGVKAVVGMALESSTRCYLRDCEAENLNLANAPGFSLYDDRQSLVIGCSARNCRAGLFIGSNDATGVTGTRGADIVGFRDTNCIFGAFVDNNSHVRFHGWESLGAQSVVFDSEETLAKDNQITVDGFYWTARRAGAWNAWNTLGGSVYLTNGTIDMTSTSGTKAVCNWGVGDGTLRIDRVVTIAGDFGLFMVDGLVQRVIRGPEVDLSSCTTPYTKGTLTRMNFGTLNSNNAVAVVTPAACTAKDSVVLQQTSGTPLATPVLTSIGADTFTVTGPAGNTAAYNWWIVPGGP